MSPIQRPLQGAAAPPAPPAFDPASLLTIPGQSNSWLTNNLPKGFANRTYSNWVTQLGLSQAQKNTIQVNLEKTETWWSQQPAGAVDTIQKVAIMMGIPLSRLAEELRSQQPGESTDCGDHYDVLTSSHATSEAPAQTSSTTPSSDIDSMILVLFVLTPYTMANTLSIFYAFRVAQARLMLLSIVHGLKPNVKIEGNSGRLCQSQPSLGSTLESHVLFSKKIVVPNCA